MKTSSSSGGVSALSLLGIAFVVLKLMGYIDWSWWWVTAPFWGGFALVVLFFIFWLFAAAAIKLVESLKGTS